MTVTFLTVIGNKAFDEYNPGTHRCCLMYLILFSS
jgi:hypothetical protein